MRTLAEIQAEVDKAIETDEAEAMIGLFDELVVPESSGPA